MQTSATPYYFYFIFAILYDIELCWLMLIAAACTPKPYHTHCHNTLRIVWLRAPVCDVPVDV